MMFKRFLSMLLCACLVVGYMPVNAAEKKEILISGFEEIEREKSVPLGTSLENLGLPESLRFYTMAESTEVLTDDSTEVLTSEATTAPVQEPTEESVQEPTVKQIGEAPVSWVSEPNYDGKVPGKYTFSPVLPNSYQAEKGVSQPAVIVTVETPQLEQTLTPEQEKQMQASLEQNPAPLTREDILKASPEMMNIQAAMPMSLSSTDQLHPGTYITTDDNENNAGTGKSDNDIDRYIEFDARNIPIEANIHIPEGKLPAQDCYLAIRAYDVDWNPQPWFGWVPTTKEYDEVRLNGKKIGFLTGLNMDWNTSYFQVPVSLLREGDNLVEVEIWDFSGSDINHPKAGELTKSGWCVTLDWMQLVCDGGSRENIQEFSLEITGAQATDQEVQVGAKTVIRANAGTFETEYSIMNSSGGIMGAYHGNGITGDERFTISMPRNCPDGKYTINGLLKRQSDGAILATDKMTFDMVDGLPVLRPTLTHKVSPADWTNGAVTITVDAIPAPCTNFRFVESPNGGNTMSKVAENNGTYKIPYTYTDMMGENKQGEYTVKIDNIDKTAPQIKRTLNTPISVMEDDSAALLRSNIESILQIEDSQSGWDGQVHISMGEDITRVPGNKQVTVQAKDRVGNTATIQCPVTVIAKPLEFSQPVSKRVGTDSSFVLTTQLLHIGPDPITETGFVWGIMQNPTIGLCNGRDKTGEIVKDRDATIQITAAQIAEGVNYYCRAYAIAGGNTYYSAQSIFSINGKQYGAISVTNNNNGSFIISRPSGQTDGEQKVYFRLQSGAAVAGTHFVIPSTQYAVIPDGSTSVKVNIQEYSADTAYQGTTATAYVRDNVQRQYFFEIYRVDGGAVIDTAHSRVTRTLPLGSKRITSPAYYRDFQNIANINSYVRIWNNFGNSPNSYDDHGHSGIGPDWKGGSNEWNQTGWRPYNNHSSGTKPSGPVYSGGIPTQWITEYYHSTCTGHELYFNVTGNEDSGNKCNARIKLESGSGDKIAFHHNFDTSSGVMNAMHFPTSALWTPVGQYQISGNHIVSSKDPDSLYFYMGTCGGGGNAWHWTGLSVYMRPHDTKGPKLLKVAPMDASVYKPGDKFTIALIFDEIIDSASNVSVQTNWGTWGSPKGVGTNVLYFEGTVPNNASGALSVQQIVNSSYVKDMYGNGSGSDSGSAGGSVDTQIPHIEIQNKGMTAGTAKAAVTASNCDSLKYTWTTSTAMPVNGWIDMAAGGGEISTRQTSGTWYLHILGTKNSNGASAHQVSSGFNFGTPESPASPLPELTVTVDNSGWAHSREILISSKPKSAKITYTGPGTISGTVSGGKLTAMQNGTYTFTLSSGEEKIVKTVGISGIDNQNPTLHIRSAGPADAVYNELIVTATAEDDLSGVASVEYVFDNSPAVPVTGWKGAQFHSLGDKYVFSYTAAETQRTEKYLHVKVTDHAGNITHQSSRYTVVKTPAETDLPQITLSVKSGVTSSMTREPVTLEWKITNIGAGGCKVTTGMTENPIQNQLAGEFQVDRNGAYKVFVRDQNGDSAEAVCVVNCIDQEPPTANISVSSELEWKSAKTVSVSDVWDKRSPQYDAQGNTTGYDGSGIQSLSWQKKGDTAWTALDSINNVYRFTVTETGNYRIKIVDQLGNISQYTVSVNRVDSVPPAAGFGTLPAPDGENGWHTGNVFIPVSVTDSNLKEWYYSVDGGTTWSAAQMTDVTGFTISTDGDYTDLLKVKAVDLAGNTTESELSSVKLDQGAPTVTVTPKIGTDSYISGSWTKEDVVFHLDTVATVSAHQKYQVKIGDGQWTDITGTSFTCSENTAPDGVSYQFRAVNMAGKPGQESAPTLVKRFLLTPEQIAQTQYESGNLTVLNLPMKDGWYTEPVTILVDKKTTVGQTDNALPADTWYKLYAKGTMAPDQGTKLEGNSIPISRDGEYVLEIWTSDAAGNETVHYTDLIQVDATNPILSNLTASQIWTNQNLTVGFTTSDATSQIQSVMYQLGTGEQKLCTVGENGTYTFIAPENGTYIVTVTDRAGNLTTGQIAISNIDKTAPQVTQLSVPTPDGTNNWYTKDVTISIDAKDLGDDGQQLSSAGLHEKAYSFDGGKTWQSENQKTFTEDGNHTVNICVRDAVGNQTVQDSISFKLDKTNPTGQARLGSTFWDSFLHTITFGLYVRNDQILTIESQDATSHIAKMEYLESSVQLTQNQLMEKTEWSTWTEDVVVSAQSRDGKQAVFYVRITDQAGNYILLSTDGMEFDTTAPEIIGVKNGTTYHTTQKFTVSDKNMKTLTLDGQSLPVDQEVTIAAVIAKTQHTIVVEDKGGNTTTCQITMEPLATITDASDFAEINNVTSASKSDLERQRKTIADMLQDPILSGNMTPEEKENLEAADQKAKDLLDQINQVTGEITDVMQKMDCYNPETVKSPDKTALRDNISEIDRLLSTDNLTPEERTDLEADKKSAENLIGTIDQIAAESKAVQEKVASFKQETVKSSDKQALEAAITEIDRLLTTQNLTADETKALEISKQQAEVLKKLAADIQSAQQKIDEAKNLVVNGTVEIPKDAEDDQKLQAVTQYVEQLVKDTGVLVQVVHKENNVYTVKFFMGQSEDQKDVVVQFCILKAQVEAGGSVVEEPLITPDTSEEQKQVISKVQEALQKPDAVKEEGLQQVVTVDKQENGDFVLHTGDEKKPVLIQKEKVEHIVEEHKLQGTSSLLAETFLKVQLTDAEAKSNTANQITTTSRLTFQITPYVRVSLVNGEFCETLKTEPVQVKDQMVTITLPLPDDFYVPEGHKIQVQHKKDDGTLYYYDAVQNNNQITFENPHGFSEFTVQTVKKNTTPAPDIPPATGDSMNLLLWMGLLSVTGGAMLILLSLRKRICQR